MSINSNPPPDILGLLDIGTSKIVCLMLARTGNGTCDGRGQDSSDRNASANPGVSPYQIIGFGHQKSRGLKASVVIDTDAAEDAVRATIAQAEQMAGATLQHAVISAACGRISSTHLSAGLDLDNSHPAANGVTQSDIDRLLDAGRNHAERDDRSALNVNALGATLDNSPMPDLALGRHGRRLSLDVHIVSADRAPLRQLLHLAERCQLSVAAIAPASMASTLAVTTPDERRRGTTIVELGAGTTSLVIYTAAGLACVHVFPVGSNHLTFDLARALAVSITEAERIKKNYAIEALAHPVAAPISSDRPRGNDHAQTNALPSPLVPIKQVTRADISKILTSRLSALFKQVQRRIDQLALPQQICGDVVLTGGGSMLVGLPAIAASILGRPVRLGAPLPHTSLPQSLLHPAFATVAGLEFVARDERLGLRLNAAPLQFASMVQPSQRRHHSF